MTRASFSFDGKIPEIMLLLIAVDNAVDISLVRNLRIELVIPSTPELCFGSIFFYDFAYSFWCCMHKMKHGVRLLSQKGSN